MPEKWPRGPTVSARTCGRPQGNDFQASRRVDGEGDEQFSLKVANIVTGLLRIEAKQGKANLVLALKALSTGEAPVQ